MGESESAAGNWGDLLPFVSFKERFALCRGGMLVTSLLHLTAGTQGKEPQTKLDWRLSTSQ